MTATVATGYWYGPWCRALADPLSIYRWSFWRIMEYSLLLLEYNMLRCFEADLKTKGD